MISGENPRAVGLPVGCPRFSTGWTHRANRLREPKGSVIPVVHTPYDCYERI